MKSDSSYSSAHSSSAHSFSSSANQSHLPDRDFNYTPADASERAVAKGGVACPFPWRLHEMLKVASEEGLEHIVSWAPHGKAFTVYKPQEFADLIMKRYVPGPGCLCLHTIALIIHPFALTLTNQNFWLQILLPNQVCFLPASAQPVRLFSILPRARQGGLLSSLFSSGTTRPCASHDSPQDQRASCHLASSLANGRTRLLQ